MADSVPIPDTIWAVHFPSLIFFHLPAMFYFTNLWFFIPIRVIIHPGFHCNLKDSYTWIWFWFWITLIYDYSIHHTPCIHLDNNQARIPLWRKFIHVVHVRNTLLTKSKLTPWKMQITLFLYMWPVYFYQSSWYSQLEKWKINLATKLFLDHVSSLCHRLTKFIFVGSLGIKLIMGTPLVEKIWTLAYT